MGIIKIHLTNLEPLVKKFECKPRTNGFYFLKILTNLKPKALPFY